MTSKKEVNVILTGWQIFYIAVAINSVIITSVSSIVAGAMIIIHFLLVDETPEEGEGGNNE